MLTKQVRDAANLYLHRVFPGIYLTTKLSEKNARRILARWFTEAQTDRIMAGHPVICSHHEGWVYDDDRCCWVCPVKGCPEASEQARIAGIQIKDGREVVEISTPTTTPVTERLDSLKSRLAALR